VTQPTEWMNEWMNTCMCRVARHSVQCNECMQCGRTVYDWICVKKYCRTVPPRTSVPLLYLSSVCGWNFRLQRCTTMVTLTAMALRSTHTDTVTLIVGFVAVLTRFFVAVWTCRRYDLSPLNRLQYRLDEPQKLQYTSFDMKEYHSLSQLILAQIMIYSLAYCDQQTNFFSINNISGNCGKLLNL